MVGHLSLGMWCDKPLSKGFWKQLPPKGWIPEGRTAHQAIVDGSDMWVVGGEYFNISFYDNVVKYNFESSVWKKVRTYGSKIPSQRYGHSLVLHKVSSYHAVFLGS